METSTFGPHVSNPTERIVHKINVKNAIKAVRHLNKREKVLYKWNRRNCNHEEAYGKAINMEGVKL